MYALPFADGEFDTVILDDVLNDADKPAAVIAEARRLLDESVQKVSEGCRASMLQNVRLNREIMAACAQRGAG